MIRVIGGVLIKCALLPSVVSSYLRVVQATFITASGQDSIKRLTCLMLIEMLSYIRMQVTIILSEV